VKQKMEETNMTMRDIRNDEPYRTKKFHHKQHRPDRDKRDFKDLHRIKKDGGGAHNWGKLTDEM
jgi:hypothetical protein